MSLHRKQLNKFKVTIERTQKKFAYTVKTLNTFKCIILLMLFNQKMSPNQIQF